MRAPAERDALDFWRRELVRAFMLRRSWDDVPAEYVTACQALLDLLGGAQKVAETKRDHYRQGRRHVLRSKDHQAMLSHGGKKRWALWRKQHGKPPRPGDEELL